MRFPFSVYWPGKSVATWLYKIKFKGESNGVPKCNHGGFGVIVRSHGRYVVFGITGYFIYINEAGMDVVLDGQNGGVCFVATLRHFWQYICSADSEGRTMNEETWKRATNEALMVARMTIQGVIAHPSASREEREKSLGIALNALCEIEEALSKCADSSTGK